MGSGNLHFSKLPGDGVAAGPRSEKQLLGGSFHGPVLAVPLPEREDVCGAKGPSSLFLDQTLGT